jgi:hypothetical protein
MSEGGRPEVGADGFDSIDPKLTVFALANGTDLTKGESHRRLEWFADGLERGILIESLPGGSFRVGVRAWSFGTDDITGQSTISEAAEATGIMELLGPAIDEANRLQPAAPDPLPPHT